MSWKVQNWYDQRIENIIARLLRAGVLAAALVVIGGAIPYLTARRLTRADYHSFHNEPAELKTVHGIFQSALSGAPRGIMQLGLLLLIATPVARVVFSVFAFAIEGDRRYVLLTMIVLAVLLYSLFGSFLMT
ncbi:MAG: DUF1634 domain-containing protein [Acidobacteria bacterium]|nr:DUF1634 domain-containing protein [Acidobacteriota bacterium]MBV9625883.1 DUF1634 domain-containing protein [Acidobacteriota bacterium]